MWTNPCLNTAISIAVIPDQIVYTGSCATTIPIDVMHTGDTLAGDTTCGTYGHDIVDAERFSNIVKNGPVYGVEIDNTISSGDKGVYTF